MVNNHDSGLLCLDLTEFPAPWLGADLLTSSLRAGYLMV